MRRLEQEEEALPARGGNLLSDVSSLTCEDLRAAAERALGRQPSPASAPPRFMSRALSMCSWSEPPICTPTKLWEGFQCLDASQFYFGRMDLVALTPVNGASGCVLGVLPRAIWPYDVLLLWGGVSRWLFLSPQRMSCGCCFSTPQAPSVCAVTPSCACIDCLTFIDKLVRPWRGWYAPACSWMMLMSVDSIKPTMGQTTLRERLLLGWRTLVVSKT